jgi:hypothetical protein
LVNNAALTNNIIYDNWKAAAADELYVQAGYSAVVTYNDIKGDFGAPSDFNFDDPPDYEETVNWFRLDDNPGSLYIDGGTRVDGLTEDFEGDDRTTSGQAYDVGWDEDT